MANVDINVTDKKIVKLIQEGCKLSKEIKSLERRFAEIKSTFSEKLDTGRHVTKNGCVVTVSETAKFSEITPEEAKKALRAKRLGKHFLACVKVSLTPLKRYLSDEELSELREEKGNTRRYSFK